MSNDANPIWKRTWVWVVAAVVAVPVLAFAWYLGSPLFLNSTVEEAFPTATVVAVPADAAAEEIEQELQETPATDAEETATEDAAEESPDTTVAPAEPVKLASGSISGADKFHEGSGTASIYELADGSRVLRLEKLDVTNGPDLHVILSPVANPDGRDDVMADGYLDLGELKGNRGNQNYEIPDDFEIGDEFSVVIYCVPFHVVFATATLT
ncbi:MAG: DM13 domain-containing protein [Acidimicrobiia bacterium]